jgi:tetratricopeptide (TPR) repeat protein
MRLTLPLRLSLITLVALVVAGAAYAGLAANRRDTATSEQTVETTRPRRQPLTTDGQIEELQARIARGAAGAQTYANLGFAFLQKARETGDPAFYPRAEAALQQARTLDADSADVWVGLGTLALARHDFAEGLRLGERAAELNPYKAAAFGVIGDAQVELGRYDQAATTFETMNNLRPDLASYARVSYMRELRGDVPGAIEAMQQAVQAGPPGTEGTAWTRVQLGHLYFNSGDLAAAEREYQRTLNELPDYLHARAGLARIEAARGDYAAAIDLYADITRQMPLAEYVIALADVQRAAGRDADADSSEGLVRIIDQLTRDNGVNTDAEMALFAADRGIDLPATLERAYAAVAARPGVHSWDVLAWTLYQSGRFDEAQAASERALRLGTRDGLMHFHAGMIALKLGQRDRARTELRAALTQNPHFSVRYGEEAARTLRTLEGTGAPVPLARR